MSVTGAERLRRAAEPGYVSPLVARGPRDAPGSLPVGSPGKVGVLDLDYRRDPHGRTVLADRFQKSPLQVMRPLYVDPALPEVPVTYLMSTGGGVVGGDRLSIEVRVAAGAHTLVTTQAATRVHRMDAGFATQEVALRLGGGAVCEWVPEPLIPFAGSRFQQRLVATCPEDSVLVVSDVITAGRLARGERWAADAVVSLVEVVRPDGTPVLVDTMRLAAPGGSPGGPGRDGDPGAGYGGPGRADDEVVTGGADAVGSLFVLAPVPAVDLAAAMRRAAEGCAGVRCGVSTLPESAGAWMRVVGAGQEAVESAVHRVWSAAREHVLGAPAPDLRKT